MREALFRAAWFTPGVRGRWGLPLLVQGRPGTAKTATIANTAKLNGLECEVVIASLREPADFLGLPIPTGDAVRYAPPSWAVRAAAAERCVVFLDELNTAAPAVQAALLRVVLDGTVGDLQLPDTVRFIAAQNDTEDAAGGWDLAPPMANRFGHIAWPAPAGEQWSDWLLSDGGGHEHADCLNAASEEARVQQDWGSPFAKARGQVSGFIRARSDLLLKQPEAGDPHASKAWPSPRTWEMACRAVASAEVHSLSAADADDLLTAYVGQGAAMEFMTWRAKVDLPDPAEVLDGKIKFKHEPKRLDRTVAVLTSCAALIAPTTAEKRAPRASALWLMLTEIMKNEVDIIVPAVRVLCNPKVRLATSVKEALPALAKLQPILHAAGIKP